MQSPAHGDKGTPLILLSLPSDTFEEVQRIAQMGTPGVNTIRVPPSDSICLPPTCREMDVELGFVCKKCHLAYTRESSLLAHQRGVCYPGALADSRGAIRLLTQQYECRACIPMVLCGSIREFRRHEAEVHNKVNRGFTKPDAGLTHEMENVVNQITALAAQAAQESGPDANANFSLKNKELGRVQAAVPIHSSGH